MPRLIPLLLQGGRFSAAFAEAPGSKIASLPSFWMISTVLSSPGLVMQRFSEAFPRATGSNVTLLSSPLTVWTVQTSFFFETKLFSEAFSKASVCD